MNDFHDPRHGELRHDHQRSGSGEQSAHGLPGNVRRCLRPFRFQGPGISGDEGLRKGAFGKDPPKQIGEHQRRDKGVADRSGANFGSDQNIANEPQYPAAHGQRGLCQGVSQEAHSGLSELETIGRAGAFEFTRWRAWSVGFFAPKRGKELIAQCRFHGVVKPIRQFDIEGIEYALSIRANMRRNDGDPCFREHRANVAQ